MWHTRTLPSLLVGLVMMGPVAAASAAGPPFELAVKKDHLFGSSKGTLVFDAESVEYRTADKDDARRWKYPDVKQVQILAPTRIAVFTYEDQGRLKLGADRTFRFEVVEGAVPPELVAFLFDRSPQPVVTAVMPPASSTPPLYRVPVKYERGGRGSDGTLLLHEEGLVYLTEAEGHARYWRLADVFAILQLDRYRLEVLAYEGGSGETRRFTFQVKTELPEGFYEALWARVNPPTLDLRKAAAGRLVVTSPPRR